MWRRMRPDARPCDNWNNISYYMTSCNILPWWKRTLLAPTGYAPDFYLLLFCSSDPIIRLILLCSSDATHSVQKEWCLWGLPYFPGNSSIRKSSGGPEESIIQTLSQKKISSLSKKKDDYSHDMVSGKCLDITCHWRLQRYGIIEGLPVALNRLPQPLQGTGVWPYLILRFNSKLFCTWT